MKRLVSCCLLLAGLMAGCNESHQTFHLEPTVSFTPALTSNEPGFSIIDGSAFTGDPVAGFTSDTSVEGSGSAVVKLSVAGAADWLQDHPDAVIKLSVTVSIDTPLGLNGQGLMADGAQVAIVPQGWSLGDPVIVGFHTGYTDAHKAILEGFGEAPGSFGDNQFSANAPSSISDGLWVVLISDTDDQSILPTIAFSHISVFLED